MLMQPPLNPAKRQINDRYFKDVVVNVVDSNFLALISERNIIPVINAPNAPRQGHMIQTENGIISGSLEAIICEGGGF